MRDKELIDELKRHNCKCGNCHLCEKKRIFSICNKRIEALEKLNARYKTALNDCLMHNANWDGIKSTVVRLKEIDQIINKALKLEGSE